MYISNENKSDNLLVDFFKDVLKSAVITFEDGVLGAHVQRPFLHDCKLETGVCETCD